MIPTKPPAVVFAIVRLDNPRYGGGPGTVIEVTYDGAKALRRYDGRDGAHPPDLRCWRGYTGVKVGDRVRIGHGY